MAAMKARRSRGSSQAQAPRRAAPVHGPRIAVMQAGGREMARAMRRWPDGRKLGPFAAGAVLMVGVAVAGAAWIGGSLFDMRETLSGAADVAASRSGFKLRQIHVVGVDGARSQEVAAAVLPDGRLSLLSADPTAVKSRVEALHWVRAAEVTRLWPSTLRVHVQRREAYALWRRNGVVTVVDVHGRPVADASMDDYANLPLLVGPDALAVAEPILAALEQAPAVRSRMHALIRVGGRRWDIELKSGVRILMPEREPERALARLEGLHKLHRLLDQSVERLDMRHTGELVVMPGAVRDLPAGPARIASLQDRRIADGA